METLRLREPEFYLGDVICFYTHGTEYLVVEVEFTERIWVILGWYDRRSIYREIRMSERALLQLITPH